MGSQAKSRICIIGGGPAGLAILKVLQETDQVRAGVWELVAFEARSELGGVWLPSPPLGNPPASPLYDALTTNLPHPVMAYQSFWFNPSTPLFPTADVVLKYLQDYATHFDLRKYIQFNARVEEAFWDGQSWNVRLAGGDLIHRFDRVVVATGRYGTPRYPDIPGLQDWLDSEMATHSVYYRNPQRYRDLTVLVIGDGPSGLDISEDISTVAKLVYQSVKNATLEDVSKIKRRGKVAQFKDQGTVVFEDGSELSGIDHVVLATGYVMSFPFLLQLRDSQTMPIPPPLPEHVTNSSYNIFPLARHIFPLQEDFPTDTLAIVGLLVRLAPLPMFEVQARYIAKVFSRAGFIDKHKESTLILARYNQLREQWGDDQRVIANQWHKMADVEQYVFRRELLDTVEASGEWYPEDWAEEMYLAKDDLRHAWKALRESGRADEWVNGVGEGGRHEWVSMMRRLMASVQVGESSEQGESGEENSEQKGESSGREGNGSEQEGKGSEQGEERCEQGGGEQGGGSGEEVVSREEEAPTRNESSYFVTHNE